MLPQVQVPSVRFRANGAAVLVACSEALRVPSEMHAYLLVCGCLSLFLLFA